MINDITVVITSIPPRAKMRERALASVNAQLVAPRAVVIQLDREKQGAAINRDAGLAKVETEWTAFLDDDDVFYPQHLKRLAETAEETNADLVFPWFDVIGGTDPFPQFEGLPWDSSKPHQIPITFLVKTDLAREVGGFSGDWNDGNVVDDYGNRMGEDYHFTLKFIKAGHSIVHLNERTWGWHHHLYNTSGLASRW